MQVPYRFARAVDLLLNGILEVTRKTLDLLGLLLEVAAETSQLADHLDLHLDSFIGLGITLSVEVLEDFRRIGQTTRLKQTRRKGLVINDTRGGQEQLRSSFVRFLHLFEKENQVLQELAPSYKCQLAKSP